MRDLATMLLAALPLLPLLPSLVLALRVPVSASDRSTCAVVSSGSAVRCWGDAANRTPLEAARGRRWVSVCSGAGQSTYVCALDDAGNATCVGLDRPSPPDPLDALACTNSFACGILRSTGKAVCWGTGARDDSSGNAYVDICKGRGFACGATRDGRASCWGSPDLGALTLPFDAHRSVLGVSCGTTHACAVLSSGNTVCWANDAVRSSTPVATPTSWASGGDVACAADDGQLQCWGDASYGQTSVPELPAGLKWETVSVGLRHVCGVASDGATRCWGQAPAEAAAAIDNFTREEMCSWHDAGTCGSFDCVFNGTHSSSSVRASSTAWVVPLATSSEMEQCQGEHTACATLEVTMPPGTPLDVRQLERDLRDELNITAGDVTILVRDTHGDVYLLLVVITDDGTGGDSGSCEKKVEDLSRLVKNPSSGLWKKSSGRFINKEYGVKVIPKVRAAGYALAAPVRAVAAGLVAAFLLVGM
eukprot:m51a1_g7376 putative C-tail anchored protein (477) ;mRNA; f:81413-83489